MQRTVTDGSVIYLKSINRGVIPIIIFLFFSSFPSLAQYNWKLAKEKDNIKIYTSEADKGLDYVKANLTVNASLSELLGVVTNHSNFVNWSYNCLESKRLEKVSDTEFYAYFLTNVPWPISDRDNVTRQKISYPENGSVRVDLEDFPNRHPKREGVVRIPYLKGYWIFKPVNSDKTEVEYFLHASPGGNIPDWLANTSVTDAPFETLKAFRKEAEK